MYMVESMVSLSIGGSVFHSHIDDRVSMNDQICLQASHISCWSTRVGCVTEVDQLCIIPLWCYNRTCKYVMKYTCVCSTNSLFSSCYFRWYIYCQQINLLSNISRTRWWKQLSRFQIMMIDQPNVSRTQVRRKYSYRLQVLVHTEAPESESQLNEATHYLK